MEYFLLAGPVIFILTTIILGKITPNYDWESDYISELSLEKYGWVQKINFIISGILIMGLCINLAGKTNIFSIKLGWYLGSLLGTLMVLAGLWDTDEKRPLKTTVGRLHDWTYRLGIISIALAGFLIGWGYKSNIIILIFSWTIAVIYLLFRLYSKKLDVKPGIRQRVIKFSTLLWIEVIAIWTLVQ